MATSTLRDDEAGACFDERAVLAFIERRMDSRELALAYHHLASCGNCRALVAAAAPNSSATGGVAATKPPSATAGRSPLQSDGSLDERIGRRVGSYLILEKLGAGGMGEVYLAKHELLQRTAAVKLLNRSLALNDAAQSRFLREGQAAAAIRHPNVATVYEVGEDQGSYYLVSELCEGETLQNRISKVPPTVDEAVRILRQIASGLAAAHAKGIVHRDIKPGNLMLAADGNVKILDFGLAKLAEASGAERDGEALTRSGETLGTPAYMSPEQLRGDKVDARTDMWSIGVVAYELLAGERPFQGATIATLSKQILDLPPRPLSDRRKDVPGQLVQLVSRLLDKRPGGRPKAMSEVVMALDSVASSPREHKRWPGRSLIVASGFVVAIVVGVVGIQSRFRSTQKTVAAEGVAINEAAASAAEAAYRAAITAWDDGDIDTYFAHFQDPLECYYNVADYPLSQVRGKREPYLQRKKGAYGLDGLLILSATDSMVEFKEHVSGDLPEATSTQRRKVVRLRLIGGQWKIVAEAETNRHKCWPDLRSRD